MSDQHINTLRHRLTSLQGARQKAQRSSKAIRDAAEQRLETVQAEMENLKGRTLTDEAAGKQYLAFAAECGHLNMILGGEK